MIPWASPLAQYRAHQEPIRSAINRVLDSGTYILGEEVELFERAFADYCGGGHAVGVASGTDALILALKAIGIGAGDEVITVSHTAVATVAAVLACGATPVVVDVDPKYYTMDPVRLEDAITPRTKAIIPVHLYGQAADMDTIGAIGRCRGIPIIEDCAQATGARCGERRVGGLGDIAAFSFYPTKNLGALGDGGMVVTADATLAARVRRLRQYGWGDSRETNEIGVNSRLDALQAAILKAKLPYLDADNSRRATIASQYNAALADLPLTLPAARQQAFHVYHLYVVECDDRDNLVAYLANQKIGSAIHYPAAVHTQKGYSERIVVPKAGLPVTAQLLPRILSLPIFPELSVADVNRVTDAIRHHYGATR